MARNPDVVRACQRRKKERAKAYVAAVRAKTFCRLCGLQPVEWHNTEHEQEPLRRIANMVNRGCTAVRIQAEIDRCDPLCRRCHMALDGRTKNLKAAFASWRMNGLTREQRQEWSRRALRAKLAKYPPKPKPLKVAKVPKPPPERKPKVYASKLTADQVRAIRAEYTAGMGTVLGVRYGVTRNLISKIVRRDVWKSLEQQAAS